MSLTLTLVRHAKSDWNDPDLSDHKRPLNTRGFKSAPRVGHWLARRGVAPDQVLVSDAMRTRQTWAAMAPFLPQPESLVEDARLYLAAPELMLRAIQSAEGTSLLMLAHNPGTAALARALVKAPPAHPGFGQYPTCAATVMRFEAASWREIGPGQGEVLDFAVPRDLPDPG